MAGPTRIPTRLDEERDRQVPWRGPWLVRCPRCDGCAHAEPERARLFCPACSLVRAGRIGLDDDGRVCQTTGPDGRWQRERRAAPAGRTVEHPLWLHDDAGDGDGRALWAVNATHLRALERVVDAAARPAPPQPVARTQPGVPAWLTAKEHRAAVRASLARLRERLASAPPAPR